MNPGTFLVCGEAVSKAKSNRSVHSVHHFVLVCQGVFDEALCIRGRRLVGAWRSGDLPGLSCRPLAIAFFRNCARRRPEAAWFADVTEEVGLHFVHDPGPVGAYFMPQLVGSGAALFDFNNDGRLDILLLQNGGPHGAKNCLYQQTPDGHFKDVSAGCGLDFAGYNMGVAVGDVNNDGWLDVLITQYNGVKLFLNNGNGTFTDVTEESGLSNPSWGASAAFFDYDRDGRLDLVVANYVDYDPTWPCTGADGSQDYCAPKTFHGRVSRLFHNVTPPRTAGKEAASQTPRVRFEDVTESSGFGRASRPWSGV